MVWRNLAVKGSSGNAEDPPVIFIHMLGGLSTYPLLSSRDTGPPRPVLLAKLLLHRSPQISAIYTIIFRLIENQQQPLHSMCCIVAMKLVLENLGRLHYRRQPVLEASRAQKLSAEQEW
ncbi:hypothetical protein BBP40_004731 [Aspergillus hancockii]|nr:hypothetical protein BBP40_004731 [Aspergillus hancockii]